MSGGLKEQFPLRLIIGAEDCTYLLDDGFTFSSVDPGGFEAASFSLPKDMPQTLRGTHVRLDSGLEVAFEGRVSEVQRSLGNKTAIQCEGYGATLKDNTASMIFVDRDLTQWQGPSTQCQIEALEQGYATGSPQVAAANGTGPPALALTAQGSWASGAVPSVEGWYDAGPENTIAAIDFNGVYGPWSDGVVLYPAFAISSDLVGSSVDAAALSPASSGGGTIPNSTVTATEARRFAYCYIQGTVGAGGGTDNYQYSLFLENVAVYGSDAIPYVGGYPRTYYPSALAEWVLEQVPGLQPGVIALTDSTNYTIPHLVYYTPVGLDQMIGDLSSAAGWHWGVWESAAALTGDPRPRLDFRPRPPLGVFTGFCMRSDTTDCDVREDLSQQFNRCVVTYSDVDGTNGVASVSMDNPILDQAGITSRTLVLSGGTMTQATAALFGQMALRYTYNEARVSGSITIEQAIQSTGGLMAPWRLKPGIDRLRVGDLPSADAFGTYNDLPLQRMEFSGSSSGYSTQLDVGWGASMVETLQARLAAATALSAVGG